MPLANARTAVGRTDASVHAGLPVSQRRIVARRLALGASCTQHPGLGPKDPPEEVCAQLRRRKEDLAIAGHLPHLARVVGKYPSGPARARVRVTGPETKPDRAKW